MPQFDTVEADDQFTVLTMELESTLGMYILQVGADATIVINSALKQHAEIFSQVASRLRQHHLSLSMWERLANMTVTYEELADRDRKAHELPPEALPIYPDKLSLREREVEIIGRAGRSFTRSDMLARARPYRILGKGYAS